MTSPYVQCLSAINPTSLTSNQELFNRIGPVLSARLLYDRNDRSQGTAFVTYEDPRDARVAVHEFDGANANGQPIRLTQLSAGSGGGARRGQPAEGGSLFDRIEKPSRSMFDRIDSSDDVGAPRRRGGGGRREDRSYRPRKGLRVPEGVDRYEPGGRDSRSPMPCRRGGGRERGGRRPGARREESGRGGGRGGKREDGKPAGGPRPKKTAEELDAEMEDYFGGGGGGNGGGAEAGNGNAQQQNGGGSAPAAPAAVGDDDIDMIE